MNIGDRFGCFEVLARSHKVKNRDRLWVVRCGCGAEHHMPAWQIRKSPDRKCRHRSQERDPAYKCWEQMKQRCYNPNKDGYRNYGGRGIKVCRQWRNSFERFLLDIGARPSLDHSVDRIDNDGDYSPENCRWATAEQQGRNRRDNLLVEFQGRRMLLVEVPRPRGMGYNTLKQRVIVLGWPLARALKRKVRSYRKQTFHPRKSP